MFVSGIQQQKQFVTQRSRLRSMLINKKSKCLQDKPKTKNLEAGRKSKKTKNASPSKPKVTPEKKTRKDQNAYNNKSNGYSYTQPIELQKSKDKEIVKPSHKKGPINDNKSRLLTTSPVLFERSASNSKQKSKDKSKSRSISKIHTTRAHLDKERELIKNVTRKLYTQTKETTKNRSASKSKSKSKTKLQFTDRDVSPIREPKRPKEFNVADREISFRKTEPHQLKKALKKKVRNKMKVQDMYMYPQTERLNRAQTEEEQPKMKFKKKVPQIKTEFSERRGSFFDENLLKKLQLGQSEGKVVEPCPFVHIKSNFEYKFQNGNAEIYSRSEIKTYDEPQWQSESQTRQLENFKRQQEQKWSKMLLELNNLKNEPQVPEKIDQLIRQLNENYSSLQEKASFFMKSSSQKSKDDSKRQEVIIRSGHLKTNSMEEQLEKSQSSSLFKYTTQVPEKPSKKSLEQPQVPNYLDKAAVKSREQVRFTKLKDKLDESFEQVIDKKIQQANEHASNLQDISLPQEDGKKQTANLGNNQSAISQAVAQIEEKKTNPISLSNDFYDFCENKRKLKLDILQKSVQYDGVSNQNVVSPKLLQELEEHKESDKNLLQELNILQVPSQYVQVLSFSKNNRTEFEAEMEQIRQIQSEEFQNMVSIDFAASHEQEIKMHEEMSSESILLPSYEATAQSNPKLDQLVSEIETLLILQFCTNILRSKEILHNFLTTYSELVEANAINTDYYVGNQVTGSYSNEQVVEVVNRLFLYLQDSLKDHFMAQIKLPFQCKPIEILRFIRCVEDEPQSLGDEKEEQSQLCIPFFGLQRIEMFETEILRNEYYIPNYFSFNHCIYDHFNDAFDELRPYGNKGKSIFSLQLSHPITSFQQAKKRILAKFEETLSLRYYEQSLPDEKFTSEEGIFQLTYFTCLDVMEQFFELEALVLYQVLNKHKRQLNFI